MIKILLVDDKPNYSEALKYILEKSGEIEVLACALNGYEAATLCKKYNPDLVLMDLQMPLCGGVEGTRLVKEYNKKIKVIILATFYNEQDVCKAIQNGAEKCILKGVESYKLIHAIKNVMNTNNLILSEIESNSNLYTE